MNETINKTARQRVLHQSERFQCQSSLKLRQNTVTAKQPYKITRAKK